MVAVEEAREEALSSQMTASLVLRVAFPLLLASALNILIQFFNTYFMGHSSPIALYLVSLYIPLSFLLLAITEAICVTNQVLVARKLGEGKLHDVGCVTLSLAGVGMVLLA